MESNAQSRFDKYSISIGSRVLIALITLNSITAQAETRPGLYFYHHDWELACDNTRTCRAAGYQGEDHEHAVSVLLTRKAGSRQPVTGQLMLGQPEDEQVLDSLPEQIGLSLLINKQVVGEVLVKKETLQAELTPKQVTALLVALPRDARIEFVSGKRRWQLSDKGAAAVLLKMDDFQGRIGTTGALVKKGAKNEDGVLPPLPVPEVLPAPLAKPQPGDERFAAEHSKAILEALRRTAIDDNCDSLTDDPDQQKELSITRLTADKLLVSAQCWLAAYNAGDGYWVIDSKPPYHAVLVTTSGSDFNNGTISAAQKGRGLGDCWSNDEWLWDGKHFIHTESATTGMCKMVAPGGAWSLPTLTHKLSQ